MVASTVRGQVLAAQPEVGDISAVVRQKKSQTKD
jgi:hypothetical protein